MTETKIEKKDEPKNDYLEGLDIPSEGLFIPPGTDFNGNGSHPGEPISTDKNIFWEVTSKKSKAGRVYILQINDLLFVRFLQANGFCRIYLGQLPMYIRIENHIVDEVTNHFIRDYVKNYIAGLDETIAQKADEYTFYRSDLEKVLLRANNIYFGEARLTWIDKTDLEIKRDSKDKAFYYFKNCFIKVTKDKIDTYDYSQLNEPIWRKQIINRDYTPTENLMMFEGEFYQLVWNVCKQNNERFDSLISALGYMLHSYKDKSNARMIVFVDEKIGHRAEANGGTGKSLVTECLRHFKNVNYKGKGWTPTQGFAFEGVSLDTDIVLIDDAIEKFPFELLFTHITDDFSVEGKGDKSFTIPFSKSPKSILTTNYSLRGEGNSYDRRKSVFEFSDYYGTDKTPKAEFGHNLFADWSERQWQKFDRFMLHAVQHFLSNGLQQLNINYAERELLELTTETFIDLMEDLKIGEPYQSNDLLKKYLELEPGYKITQTTFNKWVKKYVKTRKIKTEGNAILTDFSPFMRIGNKRCLTLKSSAAT